MAARLLTRLSTEDRARKTPENYEMRCAIVTFCLHIHAGDSSSKGIDGTLCLLLVKKGPNKPLMGPTSVPSTVSHVWDDAGITDRRLPTRPRTLGLLSLKKPIIS